MDSVNRGFLWSLEKGNLRVRIWLFCQLVVFLEKFLVFFSFRIFWVVGIEEFLVSWFYIFFFFYLVLSILVIRQKVYLERLLFIFRYLYRVFLKFIVWVLYIVFFVFIFMRVCLLQQGLVVGILKEFCFSLVRYSFVCYYVVDYVLGIMGWWQLLGILMRFRYF